MAEFKIVYPIRVRRFAPPGHGSLEQFVGQIDAYLPRLFIVREDPHGDHAVVAGTDSDGWTMTEYVLDRLASGLIFPVEKGDLEQLFEIVLNVFEEGFQAAVDELDNEGIEDLDECRLDCIDFVLANFMALREVDLSQAFRHGGDFYLARNRHGAGFWDRGYGAIGDQLSEAAKAYGATS